MSAVVSVKRDLVDALQAWPGLDGVQVAHGWPGDETRERERVWLGRARWPDAGPAAMRSGSVQTDEVGDLDVVVDVEVPGGSALEADERCVAIARQVRLCVADNRQLGHDPDAGIHVRATTLRGGELVGGYKDDGSVARMTLTLRWDARLTA